LTVPIGTAPEPSPPDEEFAAVFGERDFSYQGTFRANTSYFGLVYSSSKLKRSLDFIASFILLIAFSPVCAIIVLLIWREDGRPALFRQRRVGRGGREFHVLKFRTMKVDAEHQLRQWRENNDGLWQEYLESNFKLRNDPRVTSIGRLLRRYSLDELPQLWNVFRGEMSMVGPRPLLASEMPHYGSVASYYKRVKPGITGLWQTRGRSETRFSDRAMYDSLYIKRASFGLDLRILAATVFVMVLRRGAF
jgi:lipopolysaccharide/colanic/teichoic acid biosynthesis glycosyltransferase